LHLAQQLVSRVFASFSNEKSPFFYYTSQEAEQLLARKKEVNDSVIPSSNALLATALQELGVLLQNDSYSQRAQAMLAAQSPVFEKGLSYATQWGQLALEALHPKPQIVIVGPNAMAWVEKLQMQSTFILLAVSVLASEIPMLQGKVPVAGQTAAWVCYGNQCLAPVYSFDDLIKHV
jgi:uncharacterized protein YyaL (SSP411 family)